MRNFIFIFIIACQKLPIIGEIKGNYKLFNQDSAVVNFPGDFKNKNLLVGFIYTHCPDICPMITENMIKVSEKIKDEDLLFVLISFDSKRDKPSVLKEYGNLRKLDYKYWVLLTGEEVDSLMKEFSYVAIKEPTDNDSIYFYSHSNAVYLLDKNFRIRKRYLGTDIQADEVMKDIKSLR